MSLHDIAPERIEIGRVREGDTVRWMMFVIEEDGGDECDVYAESHESREAAAEAAASWGLPIRFIHGVGEVVYEMPARRTSASGIPITRRPM